MRFDALNNWGWREGLMIIIAFLLLYVVVVFFRMRRLKNKKAAEAISGALAAQSAVAAYAAVQDPVRESAVEPVLASSPEPLAAPSEAAFPWNEPPPEIPGQQKIEALERQVVQLRKELGVLRAELVLMREMQQREMVQESVVQNVSPLYSDAMEIAMQGHDAATISQHCGISRAEAELVVALVRNRDMQ